MLRSESNRKEKEGEMEAVVDYFRMLSRHLSQDTEIHMKSCSARDSILALPKHKSVALPLESDLLGTKCAS
jgi:hypothetical protein